MYFSEKAAFYYAEIELRTGLIRLAYSQKPLLCMRWCGTYIFFPHSTQSEHDNVIFGIKCTMQCIV